MSVVIPAYNVAAYIGETLASLQNQTLEDFEALIVDDGSTDATADIASSFLDDRRFQLIRTANAGIASARNCAIAIARAPFVSMLDGDDRYRPDYLKKMHARISADAHIAFVTCDAESFFSDSDHRERFSARYPQSEPITLTTLLTNQTKIFGLCAVRTEILRSVGGYDPQLRAAEDLDLWLRLLIAGFEGGLVPEVLVEYRRRSGSLSHDRARLMDATARALDKAVVALAGRSEQGIAAAKRDEAKAIALFENGVDLTLQGDARGGLALMRGSHLKDGNAKWQAMMRVFSLLPMLAPPALSLYRRGNQFA